MAKLQKSLPFAMAIVIGLLAALHYARFTLRGCEDCADFHRATIMGEIESPFRYRVLAPYLVQVAMPSNDGAIIIAYAAAHSIALPAMLVALYIWLKRWTSTTESMLGLTILSVYLPIMLYVWGLGGLTNPIEVVLLCLGLLAINKPPVYALVTVLATLNRETGIILPLTFAAVHLHELLSRRILLQAALYWGLWATVFVGLRLVLGNAEHAISLSEIWAINTGGGWNTNEAIMNHALFIPLWIAAAIGYSKSTPFLRRAALVIPPYLVLVAVFGVWNEVRLLLPIMPLVLPMAVKAFDIGGNVATTPLSDSE